MRLSVTKCLNWLLPSEVLLIEHLYFACMILVTSPFNFDHAITLTFGLLQAQICCRVGDHNSLSMYLLVDERQCHIIIPFELSLSDYLFGIKSVNRGCNVSDIENICCLCIGNLYNLLTSRCQSRALRYKVCVGSICMIIIITPFK